MSDVLFYIICALLLLVSGTYLLALAFICYDEVASWINTRD